jgi:hypothetical protein
VNPIRRILAARRSKQDRVTAAVQESARLNAELRRLVEQIKRTHNVREAGR